MSGGRVGDARGQREPPPAQDPPRRPPGFRLYERQAWHLRENLGPLLAASASLGPRSYALLTKGHLPVPGG